MSRFALCAVWMCTLALLSSCASTPTATVQDQKLRQLQLESIQQFSFRGGLGIWTDDESISARINWQQQADELNVELSGPLGIGDLELEYNGVKAVLKRSGRVVSEGTSIDRVLQNGLGLGAPVPMAQLQNWVKGIAGEATSVKRDEQGRLASLNYTDAQGTRWQARFLRYTVAQDLTLPSLITASGGPYSIRLVLKDWNTLAMTEKLENSPKETQTSKRLAIPSQ